MVQLRNWANRLKKRQKLGDNNCRVCCFEVSGFPTICKEMAFGQPFQSFPQGTVEPKSGIEIPTVAVLAYQAM
jgi:hypothetical protein